MHWSSQLCLEVCWLSTATTSQHIKKNTNLKSTEKFVKTLWLHVSSTISVVDWASSYCHRGLCEEALAGTFWGRPRRCRLYFTAIALIYGNLSVFKWLQRDRRIVLICFFHVALLERYADKSFKLIYSFMHRSTVISQCYGWGIIWTFAWTFASRPGCEFRITMAGNHNGFHENDSSEENQLDMLRVMVGG